jgi:hypothetical protein
MSDSLEHGAPLELVEGLGMARCSLCKAQLLITIGMMRRYVFSIGGLIPVVKHFGWSAA